MNGKDVITFFLYNIHTCCTAGLNILSVNSILKYLDDLSFVHFCMYTRIGGE